jgi:gas vesicle structural protein
MDNTQRKGNTSLLELLDRVLDTGVYISGDIVLSVADVDLIYLNLRVLLCNADTINRLRTNDNLALGAAAETKPARSL